MDAYDLIKWREIHFGLDRQAAAKALGIGKNSLRNYEENVAKIPPYLPLCCAAVSAGLSGWTLPKEMQAAKRKNPEIKPSAAPRGPRPKAKSTETA